MSVCPNCGSKHIEHHAASGSSICTECGVVVEENAIVNSVEFVENAGGASSVVGQFVAQNASKAYSAGRGGRYGFSRDSRETTLFNGKRKIQEVASRLRLGNHYIDSAHRLFTIAVEKSFTAGRRRSHVVAACLYIACRQEKSQHMLIDFSDALQVNVYTLGTCFLKFRRLLGLKLEIIDPALYVYRFAAHLELDDKANAVALTALRLVGRMKRDWIVLGRRPAGICAAALLIAARAHGFSRHHQDVTRILRVCGMTVNARLREFEQTPSAKLTLEEFNTTETDHEADPPAFTNNRIREARARAIQQKNYDLLSSGALDNPLNGKYATAWRTTTRKQKLQADHDLLYKELEKQLTHDSNDKGDTMDNGRGEELVTSKETSTELQLSNKSTIPFSNDPTENQVVQNLDGSCPSDDPRMREMYPKGNNGENLVLPNQATAEELQPSTLAMEGTLDLAAWKEEMPEKDAEDIESLFRTDEEIAEKEAIFNKLNKDYIIRQEARESEESNEAGKKNDQAGPQKKRYKKRKNTDGDTTTEEALLEAVSKRKISRKINYDAMSSLFGEEGNFTTEGIDSKEDIQDDLLYAMI